MRHTGNQQEAALGPQLVGGEPTLSVGEEGEKVVLRVRLTRGKPAPDQVRHETRILLAHLPAAPGKQRLEPQLLQRRPLHVHAGLAHHSIDGVDQEEIVGARLQPKRLPEPELPHDVVGQVPAALRHVEHLC